MVNETLYFALPGSRDLVTHAPTISCSQVIRGVYQEDGSWRTMKGTVHVIEIPFELACKGNYTPVIFDSPTLFHNQFLELNLNLGMVQTYILRTLRLQQQFDHLVDYSASLSTDPQQLRNVIEGIGSGIASIIEAPARAFEHVVTGLAKGTGGLLSTLFSGPLQVILNVLIITVSVLLFAVATYYLAVYLKNQYQRRKRWKRQTEAIAMNTNIHQQPLIYTIDTPGTLSQPSVWTRMFNHNESLD